MDTTCNSVRHTSSARGARLIDPSDTPLAKDFPITAGKVNVVVPSQYPDRDTYIIARKPTDV